MVPINVTKSNMPDIARYTEMMSELWETRNLTNGGHFLLEFERRLGDYLGVPGVVTMNNGTIALQIALELFGFLPGDEIITTPFSFIATASTIAWQKFTPVFADVNPDTFNIDPESIKEKITDRTRAIMAVHTFGNPCDIKAIESISKEHGLKVIYDSAHCFGVSVSNGSIFLEGDVSATSFHATKVFHTIEGGALFSNQENLLSKANLLRRFGIDGDDVIEIGINGKMNEFQAIMGLLNLETIDSEISRRKSKHVLYKELLDGITSFQKMSPELKAYNYCYMPVIFESEKERNTAQKKLVDKNIHSKMYFHPINKYSAFNVNNCEELENARELSSRTLTLPLYGDLKEDEIELIVKTIRMG